MARAGRRFLLRPNRGRFVRGAKPPLGAAFKEFSTGVVTISSPVSPGAWARKVNIPNTVTVNVSAPTWAAPTIPAGKSIAMATGRVTVSASAASVGTTDNNILVVIHGNPISLVMPPVAKVKVNGGGLRPVNGSYIPGDFTISPIRISGNGTKTWTWAPYTSDAVDATILGTNPDYVPTTGVLPFNLSGTVSSKKVFAQYFTPYPISEDNSATPGDYYDVNYLSPTGEGGIHSAYGGLLRDRPITRQPLTGDWRRTDMDSEVARAKAAGLDGFTVDMLMNGPTGAHWTYMSDLLDASDAAGGFHIIPMPDMTSGPGGMTPQTLGDLVALVAAHSSAFRTGSGDLVVSPFAAELKAPSWWSTFNSYMSSAHGETVALVPCFTSGTSGYLSSYASVSYGFSERGARDPASNPTGTGPGTPKALIATVQGMGKIWMQPVSVQDERPKSAAYSESENTHNLRNTWDIAINGNADWVQIPTWNNFSEGTHICPSVQHGFAYLDLCAYYAEWFRTGAAPTIVRDAVYLTHRKQPYAAHPTYAQTSLMANVGGSSPRDTVEALAFLTGSATVNINVGGTVSMFSGTSGITAFTTGAAPGTISARASRAGSDVVAVTTHSPYTMTPYVQDLQYIAESSLRMTPSPTVGGGGNPERTIWFKYVPTEDGELTITPSSSVAIRWAAFDPSQNPNDATAWTKLADYGGTPITSPTPVDLGVVTSGHPIIIGLWPGSTADVTGTLSWSMNVVQSDVLMAVLNPAVQQTPSTVRVNVTGGSPNTTVTFYVVGNATPLITFQSDDTGQVLGASVPLPAMPAGNYQVRAVYDTGETAVGDFQVLNNAPTRPTNPPTDVLPVTVAHGAVIKWTLQDPSPGGEVYVFAFNPEEAEAPYAPKNISVDHTVAANGQPILWEGRQSSWTWEFNGWCRSEDEYKALERFHALKHRFWLTDHRNVAWVVTFDSIDWQPRRVPGNNWSFNYRVSVTIWKGPVTL